MIARTAPASPLAAPSMTTVVVPPIVKRGVPPAFAVIIAITSRPPAPRISRPRIAPTVSVLATGCDRNRISRHTAPARNLLLLRAKRKADFLLHELPHGSSADLRRGVAGSRQPASYRFCEERVRCPEYDGRLRLDESGGVHNEL